MGPFRFFRRKVRPPLAVHGSWSDPSLAVAVPLGRFVREACDEELMMRLRLDVAVVDALAALELATRRAFKPAIRPPHRVD